MTIHEAIFSPTRQLLLTVCLLILTAQLILIFASIRDNRSRRLRLLYVLFFVISSVVFYMLLLDISWDLDHPNGAKALPAVLYAFVSMPVVVMILFEILSCIILIAAFRDLIRYRESHLTSQSIKETMDLLPAGIAFGKADGTVVFSNLVMRLFPGEDDLIGYT